MKNKENAQIWNEALKKALQIVEDNLTPETNHVGEKIGELIISDSDVPYLTNMEEITAYQQTLENGLGELSQAMGVDSEHYDRDQADFECYADCFKDAAKLINDAELKLMGSDTGYPESDKLADITPDARVIREFMEWCGVEETTLWNLGNEAPADLEYLIMRKHDICPIALEKERKEMLEAMQNG